MEEVLELLQKPEDLGFSIVRNQGGKGGDGAKERRRKLQRACQTLFHRVEKLGTLYNQRVEAKDRSSQGITGLNELYFGTAEGMSGGAEMVYGQVEIQNEALRRLLKTANKKLAKSVESEKDVRLLEDMDSEDDDEDEAPEENIEEAQGDSDGDNDESSDAEPTEDERIRARMNRVMDDMSEDEEEETALADRSKKSPDDQFSNMVDPVADSLKDGFFDLNEMEAFADEEEEYLPDEAFGEERPQKDDTLENKKSLHQKLREGTMDDGSGSDSDDDEDDALQIRAESTIRRKRYRDDDEIEALYKLYDKPQSSPDSDDDEENDPANMTASDIFGKPEKKYYDKWYIRKEIDLPFDDDEAYGGFDGENDEIEKDHMPRSDESDKGESGDEEVPMNDDDAGAVLEEGKSAADGQPRSRRHEKLQKQIDQIEQEMISEKPWQMKGEVQSMSRPQDSLLESTPEFEVATKQAPIITVEHTADLEDVIKKRILDEDWDDVVPRELPDVAWNKKKGELPEVSQEKSKLGLGELYEREYLKKAVGYDVDAAEKETEEDKAKNEMKTLFANLCSKLDALSNYHFAPRPVADEIELRPITKPTIAMEEVLPLHESTTQGVAPEEVYGSKRGRDGVLRGESELEQQDRKRLRSAKKASRRKARKAKLADDKLISRLQPGLGLNNPYEKRKMREELSAARARGKVTTGEADTTSYGGSATFFKRMQNQAQEAIRSKQDLESSRGSDAKAGKNSSAFKL